MSKRLIGFSPVDDGHRRVTQTESSILAGGDQRTHEVMQETVIRFEEGLAKDGKNYQEIGFREAAERLAEAHEKVRK